MRSPRSKQRWVLNRGNPRRRSSSAGRTQLANWRSQMTPGERESLETVNVKGGRTQNLLDRQAAESIAISHLFERFSVARELHAAAMLLRRGLGKVGVSDALDFIRRDGRFLRPFPESRF